MDQNINLEIDYLKIRRVLKEDEKFEYYLKPELRINSFLFISKSSKLLPKYIPNRGYLRSKLGRFWCRFCTNALDVVYYLHRESVVLV